MTIASFRRTGSALVWCCLMFGLLSKAEAQLPKVPEGFEIRLVAAVPAVKFPSQITTAPDGSLFVAEDPMDQVGPYDTNDGRILRFREQGAEPVVFAEGLRPVFGMVWYEGALYVSHMPFLSVFRDENGDGKADSREDLLTDLGITYNEQYGLNDHIVSGLQFGIDGWLYISVGDKGIFNTNGPDGRSIQIFGGGVARCRPDGTELEVFSTGTRNHLEANLDERDNLFTYDNTDDGDGWWTRVSHHVEGAYFGYPYDYHDYTYRHLPRMAEYRGGSPCGAVFYLDDAWPEEYRGVGYWTEWGKRKVHAFRFKPDGASFQVAEEFDFVTPGEVGDFRPIDLALSHDGKTLYIADWAMGGWGSKTEKVGRVFAVTSTAEVETRPRGSDADPIAAQIQALHHPAYHERVRAQRALIRAGAEALPTVSAALADPETEPVAARHLVWVLDAIAGGAPEATLPLMKALESPLADVRAQAARALGQRNVPIVVEPDFGAPMLGLLDDPEPSVRLQAAIALGRVGHPRAIPALLPTLADGDVYLAYSAREALRRIKDWETTGEGLQAEDSSVRLGVLQTLELVFEPEAAQLLIGYAENPDQPADERARALYYLAQTHRQTPPWDGKWWGTRPVQGQPPKKSVDWEATPWIERTVCEALVDPEPAVRLAAVAGVKEIASPAVRPALRERLALEPDADVRREVALALGALDDKEALPLLVMTLRDADAPEPVRDAALSSVETIGTDLAVTTLTELLASGELAAERQPRVIAALGRFKARPAVPVLLERLDDPSVVIRANAAEALGQIGQTEGVAPRVLERFEDEDIEVRKAAIRSIGALRYREAVPQLVNASYEDDTRFEATLALTAFPDTEALQVFLAGLGSRSPELRQASARALGEIRDEAAPILEQLAERRELSPSLLPELRRVFTSLKPLTDWRLLGQFDRDAEPPIQPDAPIDLDAKPLDRAGTPTAWRPAEPVDDRGQINLGEVFDPSGNQIAYGYIEIDSPEARAAEMAVGSDDTLTVWLNGREVYDFQGDRGFDHEQARFDIDLQEGVNQILIACGNTSGAWQFSVQVSDKDDYAFLEGPTGESFNPDVYAEFAMETTGDPERGQALFLDLQGLACVKCHVVGGEGGAVGPALDGVGSKYSKRENIESVLYPSAKISSGYESVVVATNDGRILTGVVKSDTASALEIEDAEAQRIVIPADEVEERQVSEVSLMPNGLAEGLSPQDFTDLISFLETLKETPATGSDSGR